MLEQDYIVMKELDGDQQRGRKLSETEPSDVFKLAAADAIKHSEKDRKRKATAAARLQCKKARYGATTVNNSLSSRMAYSR